MKYLILGMSICAAMGCASAPPLKYYTLDMTASGETPSSVPVEIDRLHAADPLARPDILIQKTPTQMEYYATHRWVANLGDLVTRKLEIELGRNENQGEGVIITGEIQNFEQVDRADGADAHLRLELEFRSRDGRRGGPPLLEKAYEITVPSDSNSPEDVVAALSRGTERLAQEIAQDIEQLPTGVQ